MGIKNLNRFIRDNCPDSIKCIPFNELHGKKIAIDISIYMYKYAGDDSLVENMYLMLGVLKYYNIIPIFIFDGKPPDEKKALLKQRRQDKKTAEEEYNKLVNNMGDIDDMNEDDKQELHVNMDALKKQFVYITRNQIETVKSMIRAFGHTYFDAPGEADELCALLVIKKRVWACLSEDMDMFVYGCPRVLRYLSLMQKTVVLYEQKSILTELRISQDEFREICILSGSDYNINMDNKMELYKTLRLFKKYKKNNNDVNINFYKWLENNNNTQIDYEMLYTIKDMFTLVDQHQKEGLKVFEQVKIINGTMRLEDIRDVMEDDGFIFSNGYP
jgi:flap endonuclease-1